MKKTDMGVGHYYYRCWKSIENPGKGCGKFYGILGKRYWWNVPAIDELTGEIIYNVKFTADGSFRA